MSDEEDDYLSDKFLAATVAPSSSQTYAERRREAQRKAELKNAQNRKKSRRQLEEESRQEGLSKSLFERAQEGEASGAGVSSKALTMMLKMGFKPGESLGKKDDPPSAPDSTSSAVGPEPPEATARSAKPSGHLVEPLPVDVWSGRVGVGKRKRAVSPTAAAKLAKVVQQAEEEAHGSYRERARQEYEERRAEGRLVAATRTCVVLDEKAGIEFHVLWLNPQDPETFPPDLLQAVTSDLGAAENVDTALESSTQKNDRLCQQMRADALQPLSSLDDDADAPSSPPLIKSEDRFTQQIEKTREFIRLSARQRLDLLLDYLRSEYLYCFWCGTQYNDEEDLQNGCPGPEENDHD